MSLGTLLGLALAMRKRTVVQSHVATMAGQGAPVLRGVEAVESQVEDAKIDLVHHHA
jgi:hypothetical protein